MLEVKAKASNIGSVAIKENNKALLTGARKPNSRADRLNPKRCAKETPKKQRITSNVSLNPSTTSDGTNRRRSKKRIKYDKLSATTKNRAATAAYHAREFGLFIVLLEAAPQVLLTLSAAYHSNVKTPGSSNLLTRGRERQRSSLRHYCARAGQVTHAA